SFLACSGTWPDIAFVRSGLVALAFFNNSRPCGPEHGIVLVDVSRPTRPLIVSSVDTPEGAHTITAHPSGRFIYASPGGLQPGPFVSIVDVSNAAKPRVVETFPAGQAGCHDISFSFTRRAKLGFCAAGVDRTTEIWDASDPMDPEPIGEIVNPAILFHHYAVATHDGRYLGLSDESVRCAPTQGSIWFYDITDPRDPKLMSWFDMPPDRYPADPVNGYCTAHNFNFVPDTYTMTLAWYNSGLNVIDFKDPSAPIEIAHYSTPNVNYWSAYFYKGRVFASDMDRGLDVFEIEGL
ncbi:MAG TPA: hypothetical protein VG408_08015, partial [Actinomycetota bacterium]|nr:hypothetical protein [Actinomycetota bacterium]